MVTMSALARNTDPITSKIAASKVKPTPQMMRLLAEFAKKSQTSEEAATKAGLLNTGYWKRVSDLRNLGYIEPRRDAAGDVMTSLTSSYRPAIVWRITPAGRQARREYKGRRKHGA